MESSEDSGLTACGNHLWRPSVETRPPMGTTEHLVV